MFEYSYEYDTLKTKVLKYVVYKKRTEYEVRTKFSEYNQELLEKVIEFLKENDYINDGVYVEKYLKEVKFLKNFSRKEICYKLQAKGINLNLLDKYQEDLKEYEEISAQNIYNKKINTVDEKKIIEYLFRKGYTSSSVSKIQKKQN